MIQLLKHSVKQADTDVIRYLGSGEAIYLLGLFNSYERFTTPTVVSAIMKTARPRGSFDYTHILLNIYI